MIDRIIDVNNKAVSLLSESGDYFGGAFFLCKALETMNGYEYPNNVDEEDDENNTDNVSSGTIRLVPTRAREVPTNILVALDTNPISLYDKAFAVMPPANDSSAASAANESRCMNSLCPILLYNLGLSLHLQGISDRRIQMSSFHESSILYHSASDLLDDVAATAGSNKNEANILLHLALFNNLGHIYYQLSRFTEAQECLNHVKDLLLASTDNQWGDDEEGGEYKHFFTSVLVNAGQHTRTSPAA